MHAFGHFLPKFSAPDGDNRSIGREIKIGDLNFMSGCRQTYYYY